jgi:ribosomal protein S18 acetylase RimI-like enzyme
MNVFEPTLDEVLGFCAEDPIERVFLEDVARRGYGRFSAVADASGSLTALCHAGANVVPSGAGTAAFAGVAAQSRARMIIGESGAVSELWELASELLPRAREDRPHQPVYVIDTPPPPGGTGLRAATLDDLSLLVPACAAAPQRELHGDPNARGAAGFRWRTAAQIEEGRSWLWAEDGVILFKAEASAWTPSAVQLQQVWVDPQARGNGNGSRGLRDLVRLLLESTPNVTLFVRSENAPAIATYESIGMRKVLEYRSVLF